MRQLVQMIDVGCFQVDLYYHPLAFSSLEAAFDPEANAHAAARILTRSRSAGASWETAIAGRAPRSGVGAVGK